MALGVDSIGQVFRVFRFPVNLDVDCKINLFLNSIDIKCHVTIRDDDLGISLKDSAELQFSVFRLINK